jgi:hypothetical protein
LKKNTSKASDRIKFSVILLMSNLLLFYLLSDSQNQIKTSCSNTYYERKGYVSLKVSANLKTKLTLKYPVKITNKQRSFVVKDVFILEQYVNNNPYSEHLNKEVEYLIEIKEEDFLLVSQSDRLEIYSHNSNINLKSRKTHEINF